MNGHKILGEPALARVRRSTERVVANAWLDAGLGPLPVPRASVILSTRNSFSAAEGAIEYVPLLPAGARPARAVPETPADELPARRPGSGALQRPPSAGSPRGDLPERPICLEVPVKPPPRHASPSSRSMPVTLVTLMSGDFLGLDGRPVDVQVDVAKRASPSFGIVGLPGKSTRESRDRIRTAIRNSGYFFPEARILVNLAPAAREKHGVGFDLPVALGILIASGQVSLRGAGGRLNCIGFLGELGLSGELRPVRGALLIADGLGRRGAREVIVPRANASEVALLDDLAVFGAEHLRDAVAVLEGESTPRPVESRCRVAAARREFGDLDFADVRGQETSKRGCLVAAAGRHNLLLLGPPGVGKTMLARRFPGILPQMSLKEAMAVLRVRSVLEGDEELGLPCERPFRAPHHTISYAGMVGGGANPRPGEVTRAHQGVLFLDEFPEFSRQVLEALREPLEEKMITIGRSSGSVTFPASFLLVAAMNPCPCGYLGHPRRACACSPRLIESYRSRLSGPLMDRVDIHLRVAPLEAGHLLTPAAGDSRLGSQRMALRVQEVSEKQERRWGRGLTNGQIALRRLLPSGIVQPEALETLRGAAEKLCLSARGFARCLRVARTIADLEGASTVGRSHVLEALQYRWPSRRVTADEL